MAGREAYSESKEGFWYASVGGGCHGEGGGELARSRAYRMIDFGSMFGFFWVLSGKWGKKLEIW